MTIEWRRVVNLREETCGACGAELVDRVGEACPDCGQYRCPYLAGPHVDPCGKTYDTREGMRRHHSFAHDQSYREYRACDHCDDDFVVKESDQRFCSVDCSNKRHQRSSKQPCAHCKETFSTRPSETQTYCSPDCANAARRRRIIRDCPHCGTRVETTPSRDQRFCSRACFNKHGATGPPEHDCEFCGDSFQGYGDRRFCSPICANESRATRPEDLTARLHELFVEEGHTVAGTSRRVPELGTEAIRQRLVDEGWYEKSTSLARQLGREDVTSFDDIQLDKPSGITSD